MSEVRVALFFLVLIGLGMLYARNLSSVYGVFMGTGENVVIGICAAVWLLNSRERLVDVAKVWIFTHFCLAAYAVTHGGKGPGGFVEDENDLALVLAMSTPLLWNFASHKALRHWRWLSYVAFALAIVAVVISGSRGGFLAIVAAIAAIWLYSNEKGRLIRIGLIVTILGVAIGSQLLPDGYIAEMQTISDPENNTRSERLVSWEIGLYMWADNPIFGVGSGNYPWTVSSYQYKVAAFDPETMRGLGGRAAHSMPITLLTELGLIGLLAFIYLLRSVFRRSAMIRKTAGHDSIEFLYAMAIPAAIFAYLVGGIFVSVLYYPPVWVVIGISLGVFNVVQEKTPGTQNSKHIAT